MKMQDKKISKSYGNSEYMRFVNETLIPFYTETLNKSNNIKENKDGKEIT